MRTLDVVDLSAAIAEHSSRGAHIVAIRPADDPYTAEMRDGDGEVFLLRRTPIVVSRASDTGAWHDGRAGMRYRDLIPGRWDGRFVASHIAVPDGGPIADSVHHHSVTFQFLAVRRGWVDVLYEDQGEAIRMLPGDIVLQPPGIRHQVLATSPGFEIVEVGCPADHRTEFDHELQLPTTGEGPRQWNGQKFSFTSPGPSATAWDSAGFVSDDSGIGAATSGLVEVRRVRRGISEGPAPMPSFDFRFLFVMDGNIEIRFDANDAISLDAGDSITLPPSLAIDVVTEDEATVLLDVTVPRTTDN